MKNRLEYTGIVLSILYICGFLFVFKIETSPLTDVRSLRSVELGVLLTGLLTPVVFMWFIIGFLKLSRELETHRMDFQFRMDLLKEKIEKLQREAKSNITKEPERGTGKSESE